MQTNRIETTLSTLKKLTDDLSSILPFREFRTSLGERLHSSLKFTWPELKIGNITAKIPVVQGGMGVGISLSGLASAVAQNGGIGVIAANGIGMLEKDYFKDGRAANLRAFKKEIRKARSKTDGIIGVNIMVAVNDFHDLLDTAIEEKVDIVFMGAGLPIKNIPVDRMREQGVKAAPIVSSVRAVEMIFRMWKKIYNQVPDAVVFEGPKAGGHLGFSEDQIENPEYQLEHIVPAIVEAIKPWELEFDRSIPVIAGGGVFTGEDVSQVLDLGASAVQMGTRFAAALESDADDSFKQAFVDCTEEQIGLIKSPVGMPGRAIRNTFIEDAEAGNRPSFTCPWQCLASCKADKAHYCISIALNNARRGKMKQGFVFAGTNAARVTEIQPVSEIVGDLSAGFSAAARQKAVHKLEEMVAKVQDLIPQYEGLAAKVRETGMAYEKALVIKLQKAKDTGVEQIRDHYNTLLTNMREMQFQLAERLAESWSFVTASQQQ